MMCLVDQCTLGSGLIVSDVKSYKNVKFSAGANSMTLMVSIASNKKCLVTNRNFLTACETATNGDQIS